MTASHDGIKPDAAGISPNWKLYSLEEDIPDKAERRKHQILSVFAYRRTKAKVEVGTSSVVTTHPSLVVVVVMAVVGTVL